MSEVSIAQAKSRFTSLINQAEGGEAVRITRRGKAVAVLVSQAEYQRLTGPRPDVLAFMSEWRSQMKRSGLAFLKPADIKGLRDHSQRPGPAWD